MYLAQRVYYENLLALEKSLSIAAGDQRCIYSTFPHSRPVLLSTLVTINAKRQSWRMSCTGRPSSSSSTRPSRMCGGSSRYTMDCSRRLHLT